MSVTKTAGGPLIITRERGLTPPEGGISGGTYDNDWSVCGLHDPSIQLQADLGAASPGAKIIFTAPANATGDIVLTLPSTSGTISTGGGGANTGLSNLTTTAINASLIPASDQSKDLGVNGTAWRNAYLHQLNLGLLYDTGGTFAFDVPARQLKDDNGTVSVDCSARRWLFDSSVKKSEDWQLRTLHASDESQQLNWNTAGIVSVTGDFTPQQDAFSSLGTALLKWVNAYITNALLSTVQNTSGDTVLNVTTRMLNDGGGSGGGVDVASGAAYSSTGDYSVDWEARKLYDTASGQVCAWGTPGTVTFAGSVHAASVVPTNGADGSFVSADAKTVTVTKGIITSIV